MMLRAWEQDEDVSTPETVASALASSRSPRRSWPGQSPENRLRLALRSNGRASRIRCADLLRPQRDVLGNDRLDEALETARA